MPARSSAIEAWMESLTPEIAPFGIRPMLIEPGFFRTELLRNESTTYAEPTIDDYAERTKEIVAAWKSVDGKQAGDPAKLADALVKLVVRSRKLADLCLLLSRPHEGEIVGQQSTRMLGVSSTD